MCDGKKCKECNQVFKGKKCNHTADIKHALNFKNDEECIYMEDDNYQKDVDYIFEEKQKIIDNQKNKILDLIKQFRLFNDYLINKKILSEEEIRKINDEIYLKINKEKI